MQRLPCKHILFVLCVTALSACEQPAPPDAPTPPPVPRDVQPADKSSVEETVESDVTGDASPVEPVTDEEPATAESFRPPDLRLRQNADNLKPLGIHEHASRRLILYADIDPETAAVLPPVIDQAFETWEEYFGPLPPARDGSDYQLTGFIMRDQSPFRTAGLLPVHLPPFAHGKHDAQQFWMNDADSDYYRRHLMIHEATHCFMQSMGGTTRDVPVWYLEGMAEHFATHAIHDDGTINFGVMPDVREHFVGFGRIPMIRREVEEGRLLSVDQVRQLQPDDFVQHNESYAWAWALCHWIDSHPRYQQPFRQLGREYVADGFDHTFTELFTENLSGLDAEWRLFVRHLCYGFDISAAAFDLQDANAGLTSDVPRVTVVANRGWQPSMWTVRKGASYNVSANGRTILAHSPKPWESEPQGISIRYNEGRPIGRLIGDVISTPDPQTGRRHVSETIDLGRDGDFTAPIDGTLYLRVNDCWNELSDNTGQYTVSLRANVDSK
ncbi:MAG: DUF1570 domain-containing protein [Planctomycetaceae bacterium]|nr:DUF1570 domain-containing protein [Planctomycetaceae bacterium]